MNTNIKIAFLLFFTTASLIAQDFQGVATYKTQRKLRHQTRQYTGRRDARSDYGNAQKAI